MSVVAPHDLFPQRNKLTLHLKELGEEKNQMKPKVNGRKGIIKKKNTVNV